MQARKFCRTVLALLRPLLCSRLQPRPLSSLPFWAQLLRIVLLLAPSSAAVERVFSIMRRTFGKDQDKALGDMIRTSLMLQYNYRNRSRGRAEDRRASFL